MPLEAFYLRVHSLYYPKNHAIAFIELALAAGVVYLIARYGIERTRSSRTATILLIFAAIAFRAPLICRCCVSSPNPARPLSLVLQFLSDNVLIGHGILGVFKFDPFLRVLAYVPFYALLIGRFLYGRWKRKASAI